jgi:Molybdopterin-binding domain of aldehyde dehydrogenase
MDQPRGPRIINTSVIRSASARAGVQRYVCTMLEMQPDDARVISPFVGGGFGSSLRAQHQVLLAALAARAEAFGARRAESAADVWAWLPASDDPADCAGRNPRHDRIRSRHGDLGIRGLPPARDRSSGCSTSAPTRNTRLNLRRLDLATSIDVRGPECRDCRSCARIRDGRTCGRPQP